MKMVRIEALSPDQLIDKISVLHCLMMSHGGEHLARYRGFLQSHHECVQSTDSRLKVAGLNDKLSVSDAAFAKSKAKGKERKKKIKSLTKSLDNLHTEVAHLSADLNRATAELLYLQAGAGFECGLSMHRTKEEFTAVLKKLYQFIFKHATEPLSVILQLEPEKLARTVNVPALKDTLVSPPLVIESTVTPVSESLGFPSNVAHASSTAGLEPNEEWVNAMVDRPDHEITNGAANVKHCSMFVQGASYVVDDLTQLIVTGSEHVSSGPSDVVVAFSAREKGDGFVPFSIVNEEAAATSSGFRFLGKLTIDVWLSIQRILSHATRPKLNGFPLGPLV
ncbi:hypothetical protein Tco_0083949 [Tanacetum coccineum]